MIRSFYGKQVKIRNHETESKYYYYVIKKEWYSDILL